MNFYQHVFKKLKNNHCRYLGQQGGLIFFEDENGRSWGAGEDCFVDEEWLNRNEPIN